MQSKATTVAQYLKEIPADRRAAVAAVRKVVLANMDVALDVVADAFRRVTVKDHIAIYSKIDPRLRKAAAKSTTRKSTSKRT